MSNPAARPDTAAAAPAKDPPRPGRTTIYAYCRLRGVPQNCLQHHLRHGVLEPALDAQRRLDIARADRLLAAATWPGSRLGRAVRQAIPAEADDPPALPPRPARTPRYKQPRRWQEKPPLPDPLAPLTEAERAALTLLRRRGFEVVPQPNGRFKVERQVLSAAEMVAKAHRMQARAARLRAGQAGATHQSAPADIAGNGHDDLLGDPTAATLLDRIRRSLAELVTAMTALKVRGIDLVRVKETIGTAVPAGMNVFPVLSANAVDVECRLGEECREAALLAPLGQGKRPGRKSLDPAKAQAALRLVAAGLSPSAAARQLGLGRSTVYRELRRADAPQGTHVTA